MKWWNKWKKRDKWSLLLISYHPIQVTVGILQLLVSVLFWFKDCKAMPITMSFIYIGMVVAFWFQDINREALYAGEHSKEASSAFKWSMSLFIFSECMFFLSFFWTFFHSALSPSSDLGLEWPPVGILPVHPLGIPLFNTVLLVSSSFTATAAHFWFTANHKTNTVLSLGLTIMLGVVFMFMQGFEYWVTSFSMSDASYGAIFFMMTGFHGVHVLFGAIFLSVCTFRIMANHNSCKKYVAMELSFWYWHFVDIVWIGLFMFVYVWS